MSPTMLPDALIEGTSEKVKSESPFVDGSKRILILLRYAYDSLRLSRGFFMSIRMPLSVFVHGSTYQFGLGDPETLGALRDPGAHGCGQRVAALDQGGSPVVVPRHVPKKTTRASS